MINRRHLFALLGGAAVAPLLPSAPSAVVDDFTTDDIRYVTTVRSETLWYGEMGRLTWSDVKDASRFEFRSALQ